MKTSLRLRCYGPHHLSWYEAKGIPYKEVTKKNRFAESGYLTRKVYDKDYAFGFIQYYSCEESYYLSSDMRSEVWVPTMEAASWSGFSDFLEGLTVEAELVSLGYLVGLYEDTGGSIVWFEGDKP